MGKKKLYHPVSLHVIRGGFEYCGCTVGRVHQVEAMPEQEVAFYSVDILTHPPSWLKKPPSKLIEAIQSCFLDDIRVTKIVTKVYASGHHDILVSLRCQVIHEDSQRQDEVLGYLSQ